MGIWNNIGGIIDSLVDPDEEARKKAAFQSQNGQLNPGDAATPAPTSTVEPDTQTAMANSIGPSAGLRRMFALAPGSGVTQPDEQPANGTGTPPYQPPGGPDRFKGELPDTPIRTAPDSGRGDAPADGGAAGLTMAPVRQPSRVESDAADIQDARDIPADIDKARKKGWLKRFGSGALNSWRNFDPRTGGGLIGMTADILDKGITDAVSPKSYAEEVKQRGLQKQWNNLAQDSALSSAKEKEQYDQWKTQTEMQDAIGKNTANLLKVPEFQQKAQNEAATLQLHQWENLKHYKHGENAALDAKFDKVGGFPDKEPADKWQRHQDQNGDISLFNPETGETRPMGNHAKAEKLTEKEISDEDMGLSSDKVISDRATASVGKEPSGKRLKPEAEEALKNMTGVTQEDGTKTYPYRNEDGSVNTQAYWEDVMNGSAQVKPSEVYEGDVSDYSQKLAAARLKYRNAEKERRTYVNDFRNALITHQPGPNAKAVPLKTIKEDFKKILDNPKYKTAKERKAAVDQWHRLVLPNIKVGD
jgi:hypothetical protein